MHKICGVNHKKNSTPVASNGLGEKLTATALQRHGSQGRLHKNCGGRAMATEQEDLRSMEGGTRLLAIAKLIGDPTNGYEIGVFSSPSELGELEPYNRFIINNRACWNALRTLPHDMFVGASQSAIKNAYTAMTSLCDGSREWNGQKNAPIEGLSMAGALQFLAEMTPETELPSFDQIPSLLDSQIHRMLSFVIRELSVSMCSQYDIELSPLYQAAFAVDLRSIQNTTQLFHAIPFFYVAALTTEEEDITAGLDFVAIRNGFHNFIELQSAVSVRFGIAENQWCDANEAMLTELSGHTEHWETMAKIRRLVRRFRHTIFAQEATPEPPVLTTEATDAVEVSEAVEAVEQGSIT